MESFIWQQADPGLKGWDIREKVRKCKVWGWVGSRLTEIKIRKGEVTLF